MIAEEELYNVSVTATGTRKSTTLQNTISHLRPINAQTLCIKSDSAPNSTIPPTYVLNENKNVQDLRESPS